MAQFTPAELITIKALGNGSANIATWQRQNTAGANTFDSYRTVCFSTTTAGRTVTIQKGTAAVSDTTQVLFNGFFLEAGSFIRPCILNGLWNVPNSSYFSGFASGTLVNGSADGYTWG